MDDALASDGLVPDDAVRVDLLRALEELKCAAEGAQACVTADVEDSQRAGSPRTAARRHLGLARVLRKELPCTHAALRAGRITEYRAFLPGHRYRSRAPVLAGPPYRRTRPGVWTLVA